MTSQIGNSLIIFGGTGDLTKRKLIPAVYNLLVDELLPERFFIVAIGRREISTQEYICQMQEAIEQYSRNTYDQDKWEVLKKRIYYYQLDFQNEQEYLVLEKYLEKLENEHQSMGNRLFYLAVSPEYFGIIVGNLHKHGLADETNGYKRVMVEKPFGSDLVSARELNDKIIETFREENTYRIDHYLGKEMLQNIMVIRFANAFFEPIWNSKYIDHVQITSSETMGVSERGGYYEKSGALKDMLQNHLLQFMALTAMEPPESLDTEAIRDEKVALIKSLTIYSEDEVAANVVRGQYSSSIDGETPAYRDELRTDDESNVETFLAIRAEINNERWAGVPFYIRTGKRMKRKCVNVIIQFKNNFQNLFEASSDMVSPNQLIIRIQPTEGIYLRFNAKKPGQSNDIIPIQMDFCQNCQIGYNSPEAYERLIYDAMRGEKTLFTRWDEVEHSWIFIDSIQRAWSKSKPEFPNYVAGTYGPDAAMNLLRRDGRKWIDED